MPSRSRLLLEGRQEAESRVEEASSLTVSAYTARSGQSGHLSGCRMPT